MKIFDTFFSKDMHRRITCIFWMCQHQIRLLPTYCVLLFYYCLHLSHISTQDTNMKILTGIVKRMTHKVSLKDWEPPTLARCRELAKVLGIDMNADHLYEELYDVKKLIPEIVSEAPSQEQNLAQKRQTLFTRTTAPNLCKLTSFLPSIPPSNTV